MSKPLSHMTPYQQMAAKQKVVRMNRINDFYHENDDVTINQAVAFIPESVSLVQQYSKLRTELVLVGAQDEITAKDILKYIYSKNPSRHRQVR